MEYKYSYPFKEHLPKRQTIKVGVAGSGNLEVIVRASSLPSSEFIVKTTVRGFEETWAAVIDRFAKAHPFGGLTYLLQDAGATPPTVSLRLHQAIETYRSGYGRGNDYLELDARERIYSLVDADSFHEFLLDENCNSPNLPKLNMQTEEDDGVVIGTAHLQGKAIAIAAQQKNFIGGAVGEVHGAKIIGLIKYAIKKKLEAIVLLIDSGGVRLQEANAGEIEISEIIRAVLEAKSHGVKTIGIVCGGNGAFGGMGIISGILDALIVNQVARIGVSGADVIQAVKGAEAFDASDRPLMWRVYGGRTRFMQGAAHYYTSHKISDISNTLSKAIHALDSGHLIGLDTVMKEHNLLQKRIDSSGNCTEEGEWLKTHLPDRFKQDPFNISDDQFLKMMK